MPHQEWEDWRAKLAESKEERLEYQNTWREQYDELSYKDMGDHYSIYVEAFGYQDQYDRKWWDQFFEEHRDEDLAVTEMGGHRGGMAKRMLEKHDNIKSWVNFEIDQMVVDDPVCTDERYHSRYLPDYLWNYPAPENLVVRKPMKNVFVAAHVFEHIKIMQLIMLVKKVITNYDYVGVEAPLESTGINWENFDGSHIFEGGWRYIISLFETWGFIVEYDGRWNAKMEKRGFKYDPTKSRIENHNRWRKNYGQMTYQDHKDYYEAIFEDTPFQRQYHFKEMEYPFERLKNKELWVLEFGGYQGELAHQILRKYDNIEGWDNFEITDRALKYRVCSDKRYNPIVLDDFIWDKPPQHMAYDVFVSSHTIEHITGYDFQKLVDKVIRHCDYCILEIPLPHDMSRGVETWHNYDGTHIQDLSWGKIQTILFDAGFTKFTMTGPPGAVWNYFGWKELKNTNE